VEADRILSQRGNHRTLPPVGSLVSIHH